ncbi:hypothetical protein JNO54_01585 [Janibacter sp. YIM B02568]|uniref:SCO6745 family protein n=1 Tax=Janibacter endophyticus TaxID=2806261 RepID=UPI00194FE306|nr:hypothetical protein [Janibacter endophyticus]MBM6544834.1 hypothetical protein [Janibacter endophyticus]
MSASAARSAYETLEPYHVVSYFNPHNDREAEPLRLSRAGMYVGGRAAPLGRVPASVVAATFYNFHPSLISFGWTEVLSAGVDEVDAARTRAVDASLRDALGEGGALRCDEGASKGVSSPDLSSVTGALRAGIVEASYAGRPLAAAWAAAPWPDEPHLQLWHAITIVREHRGDGHIAALVLADLAPVEALVLHEAPHPDPALRRKTLGKRLVLATRGWDEEDWTSATDSLARRGLLDGGGAMTTAGAELYDRLERETDAAAAGLWAAVPEADETIRRARPFVKAVIDTGYLPGTTRRD